MRAGFISKTVVFSVYLSIQLIFSCYTYPYSNYQEFLSEFKSLTFDETKVLDVSSLFITKDVANLEIDSGKFYYCKPLGGRVCAMLFAGNGNFSFTPPTKVEQNQLERFFKVMDFNSEIKYAFLIFGDTTAESFLKSFSPINEELPSRINDILKSAKYYLLDKEKNNVEDFVSKTILNSCQNDMFWAYLILEDGKVVIFYINPYDEEEVSFLRTDWYAGIGKYSENVCKFNMQGHNIETDTIDKDDIHIEKETIENVFDDDLKLSCNARLSLKVMQDNIQWVPLYLYDELQVENVKLSSGQNLIFYKSEKSPYFWVKFPPGLKKGDSLNIETSYCGKIIRFYWDYTSVKSASDWYPIHGYKNKSIFDLTYKYPKNYRLASVGKLLNEEEKDGMRTSHWLTDYKIRNATFNIGLFEDKIYEEKECIPVELLYKTSNMVDYVKQDVILSLQFYDKLFGKIKANKMYVTEFPEGMGMAFPGMLYLSTATFYFADNQGGEEQFCSHEVAHEWWGIGVDFKTYREQWLSEAFAEYSSLMYVQMVFKDNNRFFNLLKKYKDDVINVRKSFLGKGMEPGPISLGYRNSTITNPRDYDLIIYKKGAWVLHMIRNMLIDLNTMKEDVFFGLMKEFYEKYQGKSATTQDFINLLNSKIGEDTQWFFDEWINNNKIPTYKFAYKTEKTPEGKFKVRVRIKQFDVPPEFLMVIPIKIVYDDKKWSRIRIVMVGAQAEFDLPEMPLEPQKIIFNDIESVLCEVEYEDWD
jgi:hypothetical protein